MKSVFEKIKERLKEASFVDYDEHYTDNGECLVTISDALSIVSEVEAEYGNGWISCSERLPEEKAGDYYQALQLTTNDGGVVWGFYRNENKEWYVYNDHEECWDYVMDGYIIAWMELPSPYTPTTD